MEKKTERRGLGRGLSALMADVSVTAEGAGDTVSSRQVDTVVPVESLFPNPHQPRRDFAPDALEDLAASIRMKGVIQPLIVRRRGTEEYEIVAGERRWRAAQMARVHELPIIIRDLSDSEVLEIALIENIQRADLNAIEEALAYRQLMDRFGHTQERMAEALSKSRSHIANLLRLLQLPEEVQTYIREGKLTAGHARALITTANPAELARMIIAKGMTVRQAEDLAKKQGAAVGKPGRPQSRRFEKDADTRALEADLSANLRMTVQIMHEPGGEAGVLSIRYNSLEDLDLLCRGLSVLPRDGSV
ncbi:MAG: ParB/RepB/Spo0J family partition protein [Rhodobacter sp.]|nr:ParB/RepB/Spo0J family partition protein [Rhodobacter sp.]MCA3518832.1 ParB/RepB/Spo0J family partition protein [Rhodobacter sp.]MCA3524454.1 ParB/RepB/Spo0J family partition protein [Rhodobacter sp.]MCA3527630.1 ParB/RepB/Spo0J family partition protein [Rhodobacter sp.]MCA3530437.1 ParB/RepB/Spo0J family partition protein [Rhodobacter sp.]